jgi:hypothetical protein
MKLLGGCKVISSTDSVFLASRKNIKNGTLNSENKIELLVNYIAC